MRVALLTWYYPPGGFGLGRAAHLIAQGLRETGCSVTVVTASLPIGTRRTEDGIELVGCAPPETGLPAFLRRRAGIGRLVAPWYFRRVLNALHREAPFDIVEATNWHAPTTLLGTGHPPVAIRNSVPAIDVMPTTRGLRDRADLRFLHRLEKRALRRAAAVMSNTPTHHRYIEATYGLDTLWPHIVVELALDPDLLARGREAGPGSAVAPPGLLFIGRDDHRKGFRETLGAFVGILADRLRAGLVPVTLTVVGMDDTTLDAALAGHDDAARAREHIRCHPTVSEERLHQLHEGASIVVAPSRYESYGLVYREAAAFGRPLVACAEDPAAQQFIARGDCGILAGACTVPEIRAAIETLLADARLRDRLGANGRHHVRTLSRRRLGEETLDVYRRAIAIRRSSGKLPLNGDPAR